MRLKISIALVLIIVALGIWWGISHTGSVMLNPGGEVKKILPYEKYSFENLAIRGGIASKIEESGNIFYYSSEGRRISGEINPASWSLPKGVIVMARGYVDKEIYKTGLGTHNAAVYYSERGFTTYAPDFSGYGESDPEDPNALGARLVKPAEILDLIASIRATTDLPIYLWGHSNGGQIMLSVSEIIGSMDLQGQALKVRGVSLWAPVSKPFPYSILYYTDEADDKGKWLRGEIARFESEYDVFKYSVDQYLDWINIPILLHQGSQDEPVPKRWSDELAKALREKEKAIEYYVYPGADHNMRGAWDRVVARDVEFFQNVN